MRKNIHEQLSAMTSRLGWRSIAEEIISVLWLIAGLLVQQAGCYWLAWILFAKAASDTGFAIAYGVLARRSNV